MIEIKINHTVPTYKINTEMAGPTTFGLTTDKFLQKIADEAMEKGFDIEWISSISLRILVGEDVKLEEGESLTVSAIMKDWSDRAISNGYSVRMSATKIAITKKHN